MDQNEEVSCLGWVKRAKLVQVGAADEGTVTLAGDDQHAQVGVVRQGGHRLDERGDLRLAQAVQARGIVDRNGGDGAVTVATDADGHDCVLWFQPMGPRNGLMSGYPLTAQAPSTSRLAPLT